MATLKLSDMQARVWDDLLDTAATHAVDAATLLRLLNRAYVLVKATQDDRPVYLNTNSDLSLTVAALLPNFVIPSTAHVRKVLSVMPATVLHGQASAQEFERWEPWELRSMLSESPGGALIPTAYCIERVGTAGVTAANVGAWNLNFWPQPSDQGFECILRCLVEPAALSGANDTPDVDDVGAYAICDLAALVGARMIGRPELMDVISSRIPQQFQASAKMMVDAAEMGFTTDAEKGSPS